jgi:hypothetical protein
MDVISELNTAVTLSLGRSPRYPLCRRRSEPPQPVRMQRARKKPPRLGIENCTLVAKLTEGDNSKMVFKETGCESVN